MRGESSEIRIANEPFYEPFHASGSSAADQVYKQQNETKQKPPHFHRADSV